MPVGESSAKQSRQIAVGGLSPAEWLAIGDRLARMPESGYKLLVGFGRGRV